MKTCSVCGKNDAIALPVPKHVKMDKKALCSSCASLVIFILKTEGANENG
jgi:hypothetical protein